MIRQIFIFFVLSIFLLSCKKTIQNTDSVPKKTEMQVPVKRRGIDSLSKLSKSNVKDWKEYKNLHKYLQQFDNTSPNEALNMCRLSITPVPIYLFSHSTMRSTLLN